MLLGAAGSEVVLAPGQRGPSPRAPLGRQSTWTEGELVHLVSLAPVS